MGTPAGPDLAEMNAAWSAPAAGGLQLKHMSNAAQPERLVPAGLDPYTHAQMGMAVTSPLENEVVLPKDLDFACAMMVETKEFGKWQRQQLRILKQHLRQFRGLEQFYRPLRSENALRTCPGVRPGIMDALARSIG